MKSAKSSSHAAWPFTNASRASRRAGAAFFSKAAQALARRGAFHSMTAPKSTSRSGKSGRFFRSAGERRPSSRRRSSETSRGLPAKAEKHWYGESP